MPPILKQDYPLTNQLFAHHNWSCSYSLDFNMEGEPVFLAAKLLYADNGTQVTPSWFTFDNTTIADQLTAKITNPPQPTVGNSTLYLIQVSIWDYFTVSSPSVYNVSMNITKNFSPYMKTPLLSSTIPQTRIPWAYNYTFWYQNFTDDEGDTILIDCVTPTRTTNASLGDVSWMQ